MSLMIPNTLHGLQNLTESYR